MKEYHKIETLFEREEIGKHKLIIGKFGSKAVEQCQNLEWVFTEKIDGTNIRIHWDGHKVEYNGRTDNAQLHKDLHTVINEKFMTGEVEQLFEQKVGGKEVYIFCEGYGAGIQSGGGYRKDKGLIAFDVQIGNYYLSYEDMKGFTSVFGIDTVPVVCAGTLNDGLAWVMATNSSTIGDGTQKCEGVVGRLKEEMFDRYGNRMIVKIKQEDFNS